MSLSSCLYSAQAVRCCELKGASGNCVQSDAVSLAFLLRRIFSKGGILKLNLDLLRYLSMLLARPESR
jgi:hypothetical protein